MAKSERNLKKEKPNQTSELGVVKTLVFVSHDTRDAELAEEFSNLLTDASGGITKSFRSSDRKGTSGIEFGAEWYSAIMSKLGQATDVVALLTRRSLDRPWILYEAGVAKGQLGTKVFGLALGVSLAEASNGPFAQFQNSPDDEDSLTKLVIQLIQRNPDASPREEAVRRQVKAFRETLGGILKKEQATSKPVPQPSAQASSDAAIAKIFEEVKLMVASLPERLETSMRPALRRHGDHNMRWHPAMLEELLLVPFEHSEGDERLASWLIFVSLLRDDFPWLYDLGLEFYRALSSGDSAAASKAVDEILRTAQSLSRTRHTNLLRHLEGRDRHILLRHLPRILGQFFHQHPSVEKNSKPATRRIRKVRSD